MLCSDSEWLQVQSDIETISGLLLRMPLEEFMAAAEPAPGPLLRLADMTAAHNRQAQLIEIARTLLGAQRTIRALLGQVGHLPPVVGTEGTGGPWPPEPE